MIIIVNLLIDIGGTYVRLAKESEGKLYDFKKVEYKHGSAFHSIVLDYMDGEAIDTVCLSVAGPVNSNVVKLTNSDTTIDLDKLKENLGARNAVAMNDLVAFGWYASTLSNSKTIACIGMGTGFGLAFVSNAEVPIVYPSEYGHRLAIYDRNFALFKFLDIIEENPSVEFFLSGSGIAKQFTYKIYSIANRIQNSMSQEMVIDSILRNLLVNSTAYTELVMNLAEIMGSEWLKDTGKRGLEHNEKILAMQEILNHFIFLLQKDGGLGAPLMQVTSSDELAEISMKLVDNLVKNLKEELANIMLSYLPEKIYVTGGFAARFDWEKIRHSYNENPPLRHDKIVGQYAPINIVHVNDNYASIKGLQQYLRFLADNANL